MTETAPVMEHLIRFAQAHESFRRPEIEALSTLAGGGLDCEIVSYAEDSPFCVVRFGFDQSSNGRRRRRRQEQYANGGRPDLDEVIRDFESRAILSRGIYEIWGVGRDYDELNADVRRRSHHLWDTYKNVSFKFSVDSYGSTRDMAQQRQIIDSFNYLGFRGKIRMKNPQVEFAVLEEWLPTQTSSPAGSVNGTATNDEIVPSGPTHLNRVFLCRKIGESRRWLREKHDLKKRPYISTTSMDAELALLTANMALAGPGKMFLDPFVGTGGFMVAAAELGAMTLGSDIDGRSFRGKGPGLDKGVGANFQKYGLSHRFGDCITSDLTNTPFRHATHGGSQTKVVRWLDGIVSDPPYGVREGLKVLGTRKAAAVLSSTGDDIVPDAGPPPVHLIGGVPAYTLPGYVAPKKPYSFSRMLDDILAFASDTLVDGGRLAFWMPSANENEFGEEEVTVIPTHRHLQLKHECVQRFNKWSRRLLVYERLPGALDSHVDPDELQRVNGDSGDMETSLARTADELNPFRKRYFQPIPR
jgi:tRNA (guanine10-N2)-methyltransferase